MGSQVSYVSKTVLMAANKSILTTSTGGAAKILLRQKRKEKAKKRKKRKMPKTIMRHVHSLILTSHIRT
jgi:hypothetical protein